MSDDVPGGYFNPRSREGSDRLRRTLLCPCRYFNPRSREGSDAYKQYLTDHDMDFNPRSREGSDEIQLIILVEHGKISIHAPARGATNMFDDYVQLWDISIHAPARGATVYLVTYVTPTGFQSTLPRGERRYIG